MSKKFVIIVSIVGVVAIAGWVMSYLSLTRLKSLDETLSSRTAELTSARVEIEQKNNEIVQKDNEITDLTSKLSDKTAEYNKSVADAQNIAAELAQLKNSITCQNADGYVFHFTSNSAISEDLKTFVGDRGGSVVNATWETVWNNSKTAIHDLRTSEFKYAFVVFFDESSLHNKKMIFWLDQQCYLPLN